MLYLLRMFIIPSRYAVMSTGQRGCRPAGAPGVRSGPASAGRAQMPHKSPRPRYRSSTGMAVKPLSRPSGCQAVR